MVAELVERLDGEVELVPLLAAVAHLTGDPTLLDDRLAVDHARMREPQSGYTPEQRELARSRITEGFARHLAGSTPVGNDRALLHALLEFVAAEPVSERYVPLAAEELDLDAGDPRAPRWTVDAVSAAPRTLDVVVIGAGMSGLLIAHRLCQAGARVTIVEKNPAVGGTWFENTYPGCRVDNPNHMYSYSFAQRNEWPFHYSPQQVLRDYFTECAERFGLEDTIRLDTTVTAARWDETAEVWRVDVDGAHGRETLVCDVLVSAVGQLNRPKFPDLPGLDAFAGPSFHSARWRHDVDLTGRRVSVIGTGASACQFIPHVAERAASLTVLQRNPPWLLPALNYRQPVSDAQHWVFANVPMASNWYRLWLVWRMTDGLLPATVVDPDFPPTERSVGPANEQWRELLQGWIDLQTSGDDRLAEQMTPRYPPFAKRAVVDDGAFIATLRHPHVRVCTDPIDSLEEGGLRLVSGELIEADVVIYGTGFAASEFLTPMRVTGRGGADLHRQWAGDASAYLGVMVPNFPNLFLMYGPNTNIVVNGSIVFFSECEATFIGEALRVMLTGGHRSVEPTSAATAEYVRWIDDGNRGRAWTSSQVSSWYKGPSGRSAQNWPYNIVEYWERTRTVDQSALTFG